MFSWRWQNQLQILFATDSPDGDLLKEILDGYDNRVIARVKDQALTVKVGYTLVQLHSLVSGVD